MTKYSQLLKTPLNEIFINDNNIIIENKQLYKAIPILLSGNKPTSRILNSFSLIKPEIEEFLFDLSIYALLSHYVDLPDIYNPIFKNHNLLASDVRESVTSVFNNLNSTLFKFILDNDDDEIQNEEKISISIKKNIEKACTFIHPSNAQYFSHTITILAHLSESKNPIIQDKMRNFCQSLPEELILAMMIINKISNINNLNTLTQQGLNESIFESQLLNGQKDEVSSNKNATLKFITTYCKYSQTGFNHIVDFLVSHSSSMIFEDSKFNSKLKKLPHEQQEILWNDDRFQDKINSKLNINHFYIIHQIKNIFTSPKILNDLKIKNLHKDMDISPIIKSDDSTVSYKLYYVDYFSSLINNKHKIIEDSANDDILTNLSFMTSSISMYLLRNNYIDEYSETEHKNRIHPEKNGITLSFTNEKLTPEAFEIFINNTMDIISKACKKELLIDFKSSNLPSKTGIYSIIDTYYQEAQIISETQNLPSIKQKPMKF